MESAPKDWRSRWNELADDGWTTLISYLLFIVVLLAPLAATWMLDIPLDVTGWIAMGLYGWFVSAVFKALLRGELY
jgi:hypothetical protein